MPDPSEANRGQFHPAGTQQPPASWRAVAETTGVLGQITTTQDSAGTRESLISLLSTQARIKAGQPWESTALPKLPLERPVAPPGRSWTINAETTGTRRRGRVRRNSQGR